MTLRTSRLKALSSSRWAMRCSTESTAVSVPTGRLVMSRPRCLLVWDYSPPCGNGGVPGADSEALFLRDGALAADGAAHLRVPEALHERRRNAPGEKLLGGGVGLEGPGQRLERLGVFGAPAPGIRGR